MPAGKSKMVVSSVGFADWQLWLLVLAGTAVRLGYGCFAHPWFAAPDQLAWQLGLDEMARSNHWSWLQLGHAPHEGGSALIGLCSLLFAPLKAVLPPLSLAALLFDTVTRFLQVKIIIRLFGPVTAIWFGIWTVLSVPILLPWSVVNFGLHYFASIFPFVFFWILSRYQHDRILPQLLGVCCALAVSFSYENVLLLVPATWVLLNKQDKKIRPVIIFVCVFVILLLPHVFIRLVTDMGYPFRHSMLPGRETAGVFLHPEKIFTIWFTVLPASFLLSAFSIIPSIILQIAVLFLGVFLFLRNSRFEWKWLLFLFVLLFLSVYAMSNFSAVDYRQPAYTAYRHLAYIIPLFVVLMIDGFVHAGRWKTFLLAGWLFVCGIASVTYMQKKYADAKPAYRAAGWIMVQKYGTDIPQLFRLQNMADTAFRQPIAAGFGWGMAAFLLRHPDDTIAVDKLHQLTRQSPVRYQPDMINGVQYAFSPGITPVLPASSLALFNARR